MEEFDAADTLVFRSDLATLGDTDGCPDENDVQAFADGGLESSARDQLERHAHGCASCRALLRALGTEVATPKQLGRYTIERVLGRGGMGVVYAAHDGQLDRAVALKALHSGRRRGRSRRAALIREAGAMARLSHPNVVQVYDVGYEGDQVFVAMELVRGPTLRELMQQPVSWPRARQLLLDVAAGVSAAHAAGVVHRDLKPGNVLVREDGSAAVSDFGLAGWTEDDAITLVSASGPAIETGGRSRHTFRAAGTPVYMAPEQHAGEASDARTDVFAYCAMAYELLYGTLPFRASSSLGLAAAKLHGEIAAPERRDAPGWVRAVLVRGLAPEPGGRWPSMATLADRLRRPARGRWVWLGAPALVVIALALASEHDTTASCSPETLQTRWAQAQPALAHHFGALDSASRDSALSSVRDGLQAYVEAWSAACTERGLSGRALEDRQLCLGAGRAALESLLDALPGDDPELVYRLGPTVRSLPAPVGCDQRPTDSASTEEALAGQAAVRRSLATSITLMHLGRYAGSGAALEGIAAVARQWDAPWLEGNVHLQRARLALNAGDPTGAEGHAERAHALGIEHGEVAVATEAAILLTMTASRLGRPQDAQRWLRHAEATAGGLPEGDRAAADLHRAGLLSAQAGGDLEAASRYGEAAVAAAREDAAPSPWALALNLNDLANIHLLKHEIDAARSRAHEGLRAIEGLYGDEHPQGATLHATLANVELRAGDPAAAVTHLRTADAIFARTMEPTEGYRLALGLNLGTLELVRRNWAKGRAAIVPLLPILKQTRGASSEAYIGALSNVAAAELELDMLDSARTRFEDVLRVRTERDGRTTAHVAEAIMHVGLVDLAQGKLDAAKRKLEDARQLYTTAVGPTHPPIASALAGLARVALKEGRHGDAEALLVEGIALRQNSAPAERAELENLLAQARAP